MKARLSRKPDNRESRVTPSSMIILVLCKCIAIILSYFRLQ